MRGATSGIFLLSLGLSLFVGCGGPGLTGPIPPMTGPAFALSAGKTGSTSRALTLLDPATWTVVRGVPITGRGDAFLSLDPSGRAWVVHHGTIDVPENTAEVFSPSGDKLAEIQTCALGHRAVFAAGSAWVACDENLFVGALARVRLDDLSPQGSLALSFAESDAFLVSASGIVGDAIAVAGYINDGAGVLFIDPATFALSSQTRLGPSVSVSAMVANGPKALLLNVLSGLATGAPDVLELVDPASLPKSLTIFPSPSAGVVGGDGLYVYSFASSAPHATVARRALATGEITTWPSALPGIVDQMATDGASIFLSHHETASDAADGVYELDAPSGGLTLRLALPDASQLAFVTSVQAPGR